MELSVYDRLILLNILPKEGDITTLKLIRTLREELSFSEQEHAKLQFRNENNQMFWQKEGETTKDVHIGEKATDVIVATLKRLNAERRLQEAHIDLYDRFVKE